MSEPVALVLWAGGVALAWPGGDAVGSLDLVRSRADVRWVWWSARETAAPLLEAGIRPNACWDLGAAGRLLHGLRREDPPALWAAAHGLPEPDRQSGGPDLFSSEGPFDKEGQLVGGWDAWQHDEAAARAWARLALDLYLRQASAAEALPDPRATPSRTPLAVLTARSESAAALLCVELEHDGLPVARAVAAEQIEAIVGPEPVDEAEASAARAGRDALVMAHAPGATCDLRNPASVRELLLRVGLDLKDTRSWRLTPHASVPLVAALLAWRKAERVATTYGWRWLGENVSGGRLRGPWLAADGGSGRMSAGVGLHNLPAELRPAVRADEGWVLVRADLGQVEPRVLAVVSGDPAFATAAAQDDLYTPVAEKLRCDRPTAKVSVLAAMYGQTSGTAGQALADMDRAYPVAMAYLRAAEQVGRDGGQIRTWGGRLISVAPPAEGAASSYGRFVRNAMVQGAAAELFKAWAGTVRAGLLEHAGRRGSIVLCLHDELLLHVPAAQASFATELLVTSLAQTASWWAAGSRVRLVAEVTTGESWAQAH